MVGAGAGADGLGQLEKGAAEGGEVGPFEGVADDEAEQRAGPGVGEVGGEAAAFVDVFPAEEQEVLLENGLDVAGGELLADGAAVFVEDAAGGLVEHLPAAFPGHHAEVGILEIEGLEEFVEAAEGEELAAVEGAGAAAAVEAGEETVDALIDPVADAEAAVFPPGLGEAGLFADLLGIAEEDLAGDGEDFFVGEAGEEGGEEVRFDAHVAVEEDDDIVAGGAEAGVGAAAESKVPGVADETDVGEIGGEEFGGAIGAGVVDDDDFVGGAGGGEDAGEILFKEIAAVPVGDDDAGGGGVGPGVRREGFAGAEAEPEVGAGEGDSGNGDEGRGEDEERKVAREALPESHCLKDRPHAEAAAEAEPFRGAGQGELFAEGG